MMRSTTRAQRTCGTSARRSFGQRAAEGWGWHYIPDEHQPDQVAEALGARGITVTDGGIVASETLAFHAWPVRVAPIIAALRELLLHALEAHPRGVLLLIEMTWAIRSPSGAVYLRAYEGALHDLVQQHPVQAVCLYNQTALLDAQLLLSLHLHQCVQLPAGPRANPSSCRPRYTGAWMSALSSSTG